MKLTTLIQPRRDGTVRVTHAYYNCDLGQDALVNVFNNLGTAEEGATIYIAGNPGTASMTSGQLEIATNKGWTVNTDDDPDRLY